MKETESSKSNRKWNKIFQWAKDVIITPYIDTVIAVSAGFFLRHIVVDVFELETIENWLITKKSIKK
eukprot:gene10361-2890_t